MYRADDPELHRKVALKVLHPRQVDDDRARARMLLEARTLAKLDHPNVVELHDVLSVNGQIVLVMPLLEGESLAAWERSAARTWTDVVAVYTEAGAGLAAAHAVGVVHRDFKPANAVIQVDGRVRVLDFGLARFAGSDAGESLALGSPGTVDSADKVELTATGEVVGTLGYSSPEQLVGEPATAASDQFSFCTALHRALEGVPPFEGDDVESRLKSIRKGSISHATDGRVLPAWLRAIVARGLSADPAARFPSMEALLAQLSHVRGWRRWRTLVAIGSIALAFAAVIATRPLRAPAATPCDGGVADVGGVWGEVQRDHLIATLNAVDSPYLKPLRGRIFGELDKYRDRWVGAHRDACASYRRGVQSGELLDRRMSCLGQRLHDLQASVDVLRRIDRSTAISALEVVTRLPSVDDCTDIQRLDSSGLPPSPLAQRSSVDGVRAALSRVAALDRAGRSEEAKALAAATSHDAEELGYPSTIAEATLLHGKVLLGRGEFKDAAVLLARSRSVALANSLEAIAVEAGARQLYVEAVQDGRTADILRDAALLEPLSRTLVANHFARPLLLNNIGVVHMANGDRAAAKSSFEAAKAALIGDSLPDLELSCIDKNLAGLEPEPVRRNALTRSVWERRRDALGEYHLSTLEAQDAGARLEADPEKAYPLVTATCAGYDAAHPELIGLRAYCASYRAFLAEYLGHYQESLAIYRGITALVTEKVDPSYAFWGQLAEGHFRRLAGDPAGAITAFMPIANQFHGSPDWWVRYRAADAELGIGLAEIDRRRGNEGRQQLRIAAAMYKEISGHNEEAEFRLRAARALAGLGCPKTNIYGNAKVPHGTDRACN